jgi:hypothetical protein
MENKNILTIEAFTLIKLERKYNTGKKQTYYYNLKISDIDDLLLIEIDEPLSNNIIGSKFQYKLNKDKTEIIEFNII